MGKIFLQKLFTPLVYTHNDQRVMGIILRYVCWGTHRPPRGSPAADRLTRQPPRFGSTKGPPPSPSTTFAFVCFLIRSHPPSTTPETVEHPSGSNPGWEQPQWPM